MNASADHLAVLTKSYWVVASARAGRSELPITVELAIQTINNLEASLGPQRILLLRSTKELSNLIIEGRPRPKAKATKKGSLQPTKNILQMLRK